MPAPLVVAALIGAGAQLLTNKSKQPVPPFQPASFDKVPAPTFQPPPQQTDPFASAVMDAFLGSQLGLGVSRGNVGRTIGRTGLSDFELQRGQTFNPTRPGF